MLSLAAASPAFPALAADGEKLLCDAACAAVRERASLARCAAHVLLWP